MTKKAFVILILFIISVSFLKSQEIEIESIKSIQLFNPNQNNQSPFIKMNESLIVSFDVISQNQQIFTYEIFHCDYNWQKSDLPKNLYFNGLKRVKFPSPKNSFNTLINYSHYNLSFPDDKNKILISGNYIIEVYKGFSRIPEFSRKFVVYEQKSKMQMEWFRNLNDEYKKQRISTKISEINSINQITNTQYQLTFVKNNNFEDRLEDIQPSLFSPIEFVYESMNLAFEGGNEYHTFDNRLNSLTNYFIERIDRNRFGLEAYLRILDRRFDEDYVFANDINGQFYISSFRLGNLSMDPSIQSDYVLVHFQLNYPKTDDEIYVYGGFNEWMPKENHQLKYDEDKKLWHCAIWLKQGYYNYLFATKDQNNKFSTRKIHGNHWQTENKYTAIFYEKKLGERFYSVIGLSEIQTP